MAGKFGDQKKYMYIIMYDVKMFVNKKHRYTEPAIFASCSPLFISLCLSSAVRFAVHICYLPAERSVLGKTVPEVLSAVRGSMAKGHTQDRGYSFSQYGPTKAGE